MHLHEDGEIAAAGRSGTATLHVDGISGANRLGEGGGSTVEVEAVTIDDFCARHGIRPSLIKIDVEGAELEVLRGADAVLRRFRPLLLVELNPSALRDRGAAPEQLLDALAGLGYETWEVGRRGLLAPFGAADLARPELRRGYVNLFCRAASGGAEH